MMTFVPPPYDDKPQHIFSRMLGAGTSIALWPEFEDGSCDEEVIERIYHTFSPTCDFLRLPEIIWNERRKGKASQANRITLFWDNPDRVPEDSKYKRDKALLVPPR